MFLQTCLYIYIWQHVVGRNWLNNIFILLCEAKRNWFFNAPINGSNYNEHVLFWIVLSLLFRNHTLMEIEDIS